MQYLWRLSNTQEEVMAPLWWQWCPTSFKEKEDLEAPAGGENKSSPEKAQLFTFSYDCYQMGLNCWEDLKE